MNKKEVLLVDINKVKAESSDCQVKHDEVRKKLKLKKNVIKVNLLSRQKDKVDNNHKTIAKIIT